MRYLLLIGGSEDRLNNLPEAEQAKRSQAWGSYTNELVAANKMRAGERLRPSSSATTVRLNGGQRLLSDGPFAETKEQLGGFYIVETDDLDEAVELASKMPHLADGGAVEVRPIWELT
ncbi:MAG TPA: YciI family protein [Chloroflexota bacterium]|nr:YciI family protein [Chloroflexota bacterium]